MTLKDLMLLCFVAGAKGSSWQRWWRGMGKDYHDHALATLRWQEFRDQIEAMEAAILEVGESE